MNPPAKRLRVAMALGAIYLIWGTTYLAVVIMLRTIPPFAGSAMRYTFGGTLLLLWLLLFRRQAFAGLPWRRLVLAGVLLVAGGNGFAVWAQQGVPSGLAALLKKSMERRGYTIDIVANGEEGLAKVASTSYDILLVDYLRNSSLPFRGRARVGVGQRAQPPPPSPPSPLKGKEFSHEAYTILLK